MGKVWFITGAGRGFGRAFALAALRRGDSVAATVRDATSIADLQDAFGDRLAVLTLDVTDKPAVDRAVTNAAERFGRIDVAVNNAGYGLFGAVEELDADAVRRQMEVNVMGALFVTQAVLPVMREQGSGHIVQISSIGGLLGIPQLGGYNASKWALEGLSEALAQEVGAFGIHVTIVEPGQYATDWGGSSAVHSDQHPAYDPARAAMAEAMAGMDPSSAGSPDAAANVLLELVDSDAPPLRLLVGKGLTDMARGAYETRIAEWEAWRPTTDRAQQAS